MKVALIALIFGLIGESSAECNAVCAGFPDGGEKPIIAADVCFGC